ncbi:MAG: hypothetical protein IJF92_03985 [Bacilli bacterium]|nr:hypothetical protein [Bacilli bacterium]
MGNLSLGIKKFLQNKNTVTVVGVIVAIAVLYVSYNARVKQAINPIVVPYAKDTISPGTQITEDMVDTTEIPPAMIKGDVIRNQSDVIDKYSNADTVIPKGSLFYKRNVVEKEQLPANIILKYPKGYVLYNMPVDVESTYGNSMYPGNYIDIYLKAVNTLTEDQIKAGDPNADKIMYGKLLQNVKILAVKDSDGQAVFANVEEQKAPAMLVFALPNEYNILLRKASYLRTYDSSLIPVPTNESLKKNPGKVKVSDKDLRDWINDKTVWTGEEGEN